MSSTPFVATRSLGKFSRPNARFARPLPSEFAFLRFVAGMRALLAVVGGIGVLGLPMAGNATQPSVALLVSCARASQVMAECSALFVRSHVAAAAE